MTNDENVSEDAGKLMRLLFDQQKAGKSTTDEDLRAILGWREGRYKDARDELEELGKIKPIFLTVPVIAMLADVMSALTRDVLKSGQTPTLWVNQTEPYKQWLITQVSNVIANPFATPKDFHENRRSNLLSQGWKHGDAFSEKDKVADDLLTWEDMPYWYRMTITIFVTAVRTLAKEAK